MLDSLHLPFGIKHIGKMPFNTHLSEKAVESNREDVPECQEGDGYLLFKYNKGIIY